MFILLIILFLACIAILGIVLIPMLSSYVTIKQIEYHLVTNGNFYLDYEQPDRLFFKLKGNPSYELRYYRHTEELYFYNASTNKTTEIFTAPVLKLEFKKLIFKYQKDF
jgi:hypothetical protein